MRPVWNTLNFLMGGLFVFAAALQFNDPEPLRWIFIYLAAAASCIIPLMRARSWWAPAIVAAVSIAWALVHWSRGAWSVPFSEMFAEWEMKNQQVVETREMFGLIIVATWMLVVAMVAFVRRNVKVN